MFEWKNKISKQAVPVRAMKRDLQDEVAHTTERRKKCLDLHKQTSCIHVLL